MATATLTFHISVPSVGETVELGSKTSTQSITVTNGNFYQARKTVAAGYGTAVLWTTGNGGLTTWDLALLESDQPVTIQLRNDMGTDEFAQFRLAANIPFILNSDDIAGTGTDRLDGAALVDNTDFGQCDRIMVQNDSTAGGSTALVRVVLMN